MNKLILSLLILTGCGQTAQFYGHTDTLYGQAPVTTPPPTEPTPPPTEPTPTPIPPSETCDEYIIEILTLRKKLEKCKTEVECLKEENQYLRDIIGYDPPEWDK